jgi:hypothetical protein
VKKTHSISDAGPVEIVLYVLDSLGGKAENLSKLQERAFEIQKENSYLREFRFINFDKGVHSYELLDAVNSSILSGLIVEEESENATSYRLSEIGVKNWQFIRNVLF